MTRQRPGVLTAASWTFGGLNINETNPAAVGASGFSSQKRLDLHSSS